MCFMWSTDLLDYTFLLNRFCRLTLWCSCSHLQFSGFAVSSICWFSMLVFFSLATYLPKQIAIIRELILGFISLRRAWNSAAIDNGLWQMLYSNLFDNDSTCTSKEQDHKLVPDGKDVVFHGGMGVDPTINVDWKEAVRRKCEGNGSHIFIIFLWCDLMASLFLNTWTITFYTFRGNHDINVIWISKLVQASVTGSCGASCLTKLSLFVLRWFCSHVYKSCKLVFLLFHVAFSFGWYTDVWCLVKGNQISVTVPNWIQKVKPCETHFCDGRIMVS